MNEEQQYRRKLRNKLIGNSENDKYIKIVNEFSKLPLPFITKIMKEGVKEFLHKVNMRTEALNIYRNTN